MPKFKYEVKEALAKLVEVEAANADDAYEKVQQLYTASGIVLGGDDYLDTEIIEIDTVLDATQFIK